MKNLIFTLIICFAIINVEAQNEVKPSRKRSDTIQTTLIEFSLSRQTTKIPKFIKSRSQVIFSSNEVNTFLYSVKIIEQQRDLFNQEDFANKGLNYEYKPADFSVTELSMIDFLIPDVNDHQKVKQRNQNLSDQTILKDSLERLILLRNESYLHREKIIARDSLSLRSAQITRDISRLPTDSEQLAKKNEFESLNQDIDNKIASIDRQINSSLLPERDTARINNKIRNIDTSILLINRAIKALENQYNDLIENDATDNLLIQEYKEKYIKYRIMVARINQKINLYDELLFLLYSPEPFDSIRKQKERVLRIYLGNDISQIQILAKCNESIGELDGLYYELSDVLTRMNDRSRLDPAFTKLSSFHTSIARDKYGELFKQIVIIYNAININNWTVNYQTTNISDKADRIFYSLEFKPISNEYTLPIQTKNYDYNFDIRGGIKVDVSAGLLYNLKLNDQQVRLEKETDTTTRLIKINNQNNFIPSVGALFNVYFRNEASIKPTFNFGVGTNIDKLRYYLGFGLLVGKSERIIINFGAVGGEVKTISDEYKEETTILAGSTSNWQNTDFMQKGDTFRIGMYFGVTYNLSGKNNQEMSAMIRK
ncbi:MAG: hypothetical protein FD170_3804 [Bacteroidetes bacterium]|nr:MAG: hypothetical protein FD170_3804 [Bacteroidota bacterium]